MRMRLFVALAALFCTATAVAWQIQEYKSGIVWPEPPVIDPGPSRRGPPSDAIVLFDGKTSMPGKTARSGWSKTASRNRRREARSRRSKSSATASCTSNSPRRRR